MRGVTIQNVRLDFFWLRSLLSQASLSLKGMMAACKLIRLLLAPSIHSFGTPKPGKFMPVGSQGKASLALGGVMRL